MLLLALAAVRAVESTPADVYRNPIVHADYSDPDVIRVGEAFFMTASSFSSVPGLPILRSTDLVHWTLIGHAAPRLPSPDFDTPQHGKGLWAPSLRFHDGRFWIYVGDPDRGIFVTTAREAAGPWSPLTLVKAAKGAIDPCPLWADDGRVYLVHAWAKSRAGFNSVLTVTPLAADGMSVAGPDTMVFDGHERHPTIEGPKFYQRNGYTYIFAPAGGVATGWQTVLRSKSVTGPYEDRIVLRQSATKVNGPHQGGWVESAAGESWFVHFQDVGAYGRIVHLQPMQWRGDWPVIGADPDGDGVGEPVESFRMPAPSGDISGPRASDEFTTAGAAGGLGLQWQWNANPARGWFDLRAREGWLRLTAAAAPASAANLFDLPNLLLQKFPAERFTVTTRVDASRLSVGDRAGLVIAGRDSAALSVTRDAAGYAVQFILAKDADKGSRDVAGPSARIASARAVWLRVEVSPVATPNPAESSPAAVWSYSLDGTRFTRMGETFRVRPGVWVGARVGLFASAPSAASGAPGFADIDWFRIEGMK